MPRPATVPISRLRWAILYSEQGGCCAGCFKPLCEDAQVDHVIPLARGGQDVFENMQLLHGACNLRKRAMSAEVWFRQSWRALLAESSKAGRRKVTFDLDPDLVKQLRVAARRSRQPLSSLVEEGARHVLELRFRIVSASSGVQGPTSTCLKAGELRNGDLFDLSAQRVVSPQVCVCS